MKKRVKLRWDRVGIALFAVMLVVFVLVLGVKALMKPITASAQGDVSTLPGESEQQAPKGDPAPVRTSFLSVGDNLIHDSIYKQANARAGGTGYDFAFAYEKIADTIASVDVATLNQETIISPEDPLSSYPLFNSPPELGNHMVDIGFDIYNMATNHMLDVYESGLRNAINYWQTKPNILVTGAYLNSTDMMKPEVYEKNGLKIGVVGTTQYTNGLSLPQGSELSYILTSETDLLKQKIEATKAVSDIVMVQAHWGVEYDTTPSADQKQLAQMMVDWGADIIIGHHPHVIQPVEYLTRADGSKALVVYSLGNFISAQDRAPTVIEGMLCYDVLKDAEGKCTIDNVRYEPLIDHYDSGYKNIQVWKLSDYTEEKANAHGVRARDSQFSMDYINEFVSGIIDQQFLSPAVDDGLSIAPYTSSKEDQTSKDAA